MQVEDYTNNRLSTGLRFIVRGGVSIPTVAPDPKGGLDTLPPMGWLPWCQLGFLPGAVGGGGVVNFGSKGGGGSRASGL